MWYCIKCGKPTPKEKLIRGYCPDCFVKYNDVFKKPLEVKVTICPICNSWQYRGEWSPPLSIPEIIEYILVHEASKSLIEGAELKSLYLDDWSQLDPSIVNVRAVLEVSVDGKPVSITREFTAKITYHKCPRCLARSIGKYSHLVQIRFTSRDFTRELVRDVVKTATSGINPDLIININELPEGVDIELDNPTIARRIIEVLTRKYSARITSSFKPTRYDSSSGKWLGVVTYVARIPVFKEEDIVLYKGKLGVVKLVDKNKLLIMNLETNTLEEVDLGLYWKNQLKHPTRIEKEEYIVREVVDNKILVENPSTGEKRVLKPSRLTNNLKPGDRIILIRADDIESFVPIEKGG